MTLVLSAAESARPDRPSRADADRARPASDEARVALLARWAACLAATERPAVLLDAGDDHRILAVSPRALGGDDAAAWVGTRLDERLGAAVLSPALLAAVSARCVVSIETGDRPLDLEVTPVRLHGESTPWARVVSWTPSLLAGARTRGRLSGALDGLLALDAVVAAAQQPLERPDAPVVRGPWAGA